MTMNKRRLNAAGWRLNQRQPSLAAPQRGIELIDNFRPVGIFEEFFPQERCLRGTPERRIGQHNAGRQRRVRGQELPDTLRVRRQAQLGEEFRERV